MSINNTHRRLGHINFRTLREIIAKGLVSGLEVDPSSTPDFCKSCVQGKAPRLPFPKESSTVYRTYGEKVSSDVWGPAQVTSLGGNRYYILFHDHSSAEERVAFMKKKSEAFGHYRQYEAWVKKQRTVKGIKCLGTDNGGEYTSTEFKTHLANAGTTRHLTVHDSPQSNSVAERSNRTHVERARSMLIGASLPPFLWAEAVQHSVWLHVRLPTRSLPEGKTPLEMVSLPKPDLHGVLEWGVPVWVKKLNAGKLDACAVEGRFMGYDEEVKGYRVYWAAKRSVSVEHDVYVDRNAAMNPGDVVFEGEWGVLQSTTAPINPIENRDDVAPKVAQDSPAAPVDSPTPPTAPPTTENRALTPPRSPAPTRRRNSLVGLAQPDPTQYGRGK